MMLNDQVVHPGPMSSSTDDDKNHANFRDLRNAWEEKSNSSSSTWRAGNCEGDNKERSRMLQLLPVKAARWDPDDTPILAWQREWQMEKRVSGCGLLYPPRSTTSSSYSSYSSSSSSSPSFAGNDDDIEEEAKRKLSAFLSKPSGLNWDDLVRSLATYDRGGRRGRRRRRRKGGNRASSPPAPMLNKIITVISQSDNNYEFDDVSAMSDGESHRRMEFWGEEKPDNWGNDDDNKAKRRDRLERMIEGVITGKISVDARDVAREKVSQVITTEQRSPRLLEERRQRQDAGETTQGDAKVNVGDERTTPPRPDGGEDAVRKYDIASPPKRKSLLVLGSAFSPIRSRADRAGEKTKSTRVNASKKSPVCQGTPQTFATSSSTRSSMSSGSDSNNISKMNMKRPMLIADGNATALRPTAPLHHLHYHNRLHNYNHITPNVTDENSLRAPPAVMSLPSSLPLISSVVARPSLGTLCSAGSLDGGWSSLESESDATPSGSAARILPPLIVPPLNVTTIDVVGVALKRKERHEQQQHQLYYQQRNCGGSFSRSSRESPSNVAGVNSTQSFAKTTFARGECRVNGRDNDMSAAFPSIPDGTVCRAAGGVNGDQNTEEGVGISPPCPDKGKKPQNVGRADRLGACATTVTCTSTTAATYFPMKNIAVASQKKKSIIEANSAPSSSSSNIMMTPNAMMESRTFDVLAVNNSQKGGIDALVRMPILLLPDSLPLNLRQPTCWQLTRYRISKTRGEF